MATGVTSWSLTAGDNATSDSAINWAEGQAPSTVNDSARALMTSVAKWRNDITGVNVTGGSGTAYTITSGQVIASNVDGFTIQFTPGTTNTGAVTLAVDGNTARAVRFLSGVDLPAGVLVSGSLYQVTYRLATTEWLLHSFNSAIYSIPIGGMIDYTAATAPNGAFVLPQGQAISRTTYSTYFSLVSTTYGVGDGSTTFNVPDLVGRVSAMRDGGSARLSASYFGGNPANLGAVGGLESSTLLTANLPPYTPAGTVSVDSTGSDNILRGSNAGDVSLASGSAAVLNGIVQSSLSLNNITSTGTLVGTAQGGVSTPVRTVQPTIILNKIMRVL